ncbi:MAG: GntR family transcriptional regulator [Atopobiaceae bacterium]|nr:GntR family transcriptional regulator [Atopobiaceae bacterium]
MKLEGDSLIPLYQQVINDIRSGIDDGRYAVGQKIPSESELSEMYSVSRITIRRAIEELSTDGYLTKKQGKGTYVTTRKLQSKLTQAGALTSFSDVCSEAGVKSGARLLDCAHMPADATLAKDLNVSENADVLRIRRIRTADGVPAVFEVTYFSFDKFPFLETEKLDNQNLYDVIERGSGKHPQHVQDALIEMSQANAELSELLGVSPGEPLFREVGTIVDEANEPVFVCDLRIVARHFALRITR